MIASCAQIMPNRVDFLNSKRSTKIHVESHYRHQRCEGHNDVMRLGILFIILAVIGLLVIILVPILAPDVMQSLAPVICGPGYTIRQDRYEYSRPGEYSVSVTHTCIGDGDSFEADSRMMLAGFLVFGGFLTSGIFLMTRGATRWTKKLASSGYVSVTNVTPDGTYTQKFPASDGTAGKVKRDPAVGQQLQQITDMLTSIGMAPADIVVERRKREELGFAGNAMDGDSLTERLQQLEDAFNKGLITADEYARKRQDILDSF